MMKRIYFVLFIIISSFSISAQSNFLPKTYISNATTYARVNFNPNAEMYAITSLLPVDTTGKSITWLYWFYKPNVTDTGYTVNVIVVFGFPVITGLTSFNIPGSYLRPLGTAFCESNLAIQEAENNGGRVFRQTYPNTTISATVFKIPGTPDTSKPYWTFLYRDSSASQFQIFNIDGISCTYIPIGISQISSEVPEKFSLSQNYPNPFNPVTKINFSLSRSTFVQLNIYDINGKLLDRLVNQNLLPGTYEAELNASNLSSGLYFYTLIAGDYIETKKMVLVK